MLHLRTLGAVDLADAAGTRHAAILVRPKQVGLLTYLVLADAEYVRRDVLLSLFWPDAATQNARSSLRSAIYFIRQTLGANVIRTRGDEEVGVDRALLTCDAAMVEEALAAGELEAAVRGYTGPLLDGFHVAASGEFEQWLDRRRTALHRSVTAAARQLSLDAVRAGDGARALAFARREHELDPDDATARERLAELVARDGEVALAQVREATRTPLSLPAVAVAADSSPAARPGAPSAASPALPTVRWRRPGRVATAAILLAATVAVASALMAWPRGPGSGRVDSMAREITRAHGAALDAMLRSPRGSESEVDALRAFASGERALRAGHYAAAVSDFTRAVLADSSLALAHHRLSVAATWAGQPGLAARAADASLRHADRLSRHDRLVAEGWRFHVRAQPDSAWLRYRSVVVEAPDHAEAWAQVGEVAFHWGPVLGIPMDSARAAFTRAAALMPVDVGILTHLARTMARAGDARGLDSVSAMALALAPDPTTSLELRALRATMQGATADLRQALADGYASGANITVALISVATATANLDAARILATPLAGELPGDEPEALLQMLLASIAASHGHPAVDVELARLFRRTEARALEVLALNDVVNDSLRTPELRALASRVAVPHPADAGLTASGAYVDARGIYSPRRALLVGLLRAKAGGADDRAIALRIADSLAAWKGPVPGDAPFAMMYARVLRAELSLRAGDARAALTALGPAPLEPNASLPHLNSWPVAHHRWLRARAHHQLGNRREALHWLEGFPDPGGYDLLYLRRVLELRTDLLSAAGEHAEAARDRATLARLGAR